MVYIIQQVINGTLGFSCVFEVKCIPSNTKLHLTFDLVYWIRRVSIVGGVNLPITAGKISQDGAMAS